MAWVTKRKIRRSAASAERNAIWFLHNGAICQCYFAMTQDSDRTIFKYFYFAFYRYCYFGCWWFHSWNLWSWIFYRKGSGRTGIDCFYQRWFVCCFRLNPWSVSWLEYFRQPMKTTSGMDAEIGLPDNGQVVFGIFFFKHVLWMVSWSVDRLIGWWGYSVII